MLPDGSPTGCSYAEVHGRFWPLGDAAELERQVEAAALLGVGERTFRRWCRRCEDEGEPGLLDRRIGKAIGTVGCRWTDVRRSSICIGRAIRASPRGTSTNIWCMTTGLRGATAGPRSSCKAGICCRRRSAVARTVGSGLAVRCLQMQCCTRMPRGTRGWPEGPPLDLVVTMDDATSDIYLGVSGRRRRHGVDVPGAAGGVRATWPAAEPVLDRGQSLAFTQPKPAAGWIAASRPRSGARWHIWASSISRRIRLRRAAVRSDCFTPCRIACRRNWR